MITLRLILLLVAFIILLLAAFQVVAPTRINLVALGLAFAVLALILPVIPVVP